MPEGAAPARQDSRATSTRSAQDPIAVCTTDRLSEAVCTELSPTRLPSIDRQDAATRSASVSQSVAGAPTHNLGHLRERPRTDENGDDLSRARTRTRHGGSKGTSSGGGGGGGGGESFNGTSSGGLKPSSRQTRLVDLAPAVTPCAASVPSRAASSSSFAAPMGAVLVSPSLLDHSASAPHGAEVASSTAPARQNSGRQTTRSAADAIAVCVTDMLDEAVLTGVDMAHSAVPSASASSISRDRKSVV